KKVSQGGTPAASASKTDGGKVTLEPLTSTTPPAGSSSAATQPATPPVPPPAYSDASKSPRTDPFAKPDAIDAIAKGGGAKNDDWNTILNQQPMLMTETPVPAGAARSGATGSTASEVKPAGSSAGAGAGAAAGVNSGAAAPSADAQRASVASARIPGSAAAIDPTKEYRVQPGDSLHKIAIKLYGKSTEADRIYQLNKQTIGDDPHRLKIGQILQLPEPPTVSTAASTPR